MWLIVVRTLLMRLPKSIGRCLRPALAGLRHEPCFTVSSIGDHRYRTELHPRRARSHRRHDAYGWAGVRVEPVPVARIITNEGVREVSDDEFRRAFGLRTRQELDAAWDAKVEGYVKAILRGCDLDEYGNAAVREAKKRIALREGHDRAS
jgi:hypothetical protein